MRETYFNRNLRIPDDFSAQTTAKTKIPLHFVCCARHLTLKFYLVSVLRPYYTRTTNKFGKHLVRHLV